MTSRFLTTPNRLDKYKGGGELRYEPGSLWNKRVPVQTPFLKVIHPITTTSYQEGSNSVVLVKHWLLAFLALYNTIFDCEFHSFIYIIPPRS